MCHFFLFLPCAIFSCAIISNAIFTVPFFPVPFLPVPFFPTFGYGLCPLARHFIHIAQQLVRDASPMWSRIYHTCTKKMY